MTLDPFWDRVDASGPCWEWLGGRTNGYGSVHRDGRSQLSHRVSWELLVGSIPEGLHLDHLCRVRHCVNPDHLEPVTPGENTRRGVAGLATAARQRAVLRCPSGHEYTEENTITYGPRRYRKCRTCTNANQRRCYAARQERRVT